MSDNNTSKEVAISQPTADQIVAFVEVVGGDARLAIEEAAQLINGGQPDQALALLQTAWDKVQELEKHGEVAAQVVSGLQSMLDEVAAQRDEAEQRASELEDDLQTAEMRAMEEAEEYFYDGLDMDFIHQEVEETFQESVQYYVSELIRQGRLEEAAELEQAAGLRAEQMQSSDDLLDKYRHVVHQGWQERHNQMAQQLRMEGNADIDEDDDADEDSDDVEDIVA